MVISAGTGARASGGEGRGARGEGGVALTDTGLGTGTYISLGGLLGGTHIGVIHGWFQVTSSEYTTLPVSSSSNLYLKFKNYTCKPGVTFSPDGVWDRTQNERMVAAAAAGGYRKHLIGRKPFVVDRCCRAV